jgi:hypothetical protein
MIARQILLFLFVVHIAVAQSNIWALRLGGSSPDYERIFLPKGSPLRPPTFRGLDDLKPSDKYPDTNQLNAVFAEPSRERTNALYRSCSPEIPLGDLSVQCPGELLTREQVSELLRDTVAIPRTMWTNHVYRYDRGGRYVFSLVGTKGQTYVVDERPGAFALVFFPDRTYRCLVGPGYWFLPSPQSGRRGDFSPRLPHHRTCGSASGGSWQS